MTTSLSSALSDSLLLGAQRPRLWSAPSWASSAGDEAIALAEMAGLELDDWQQFVLRESLGERPDQKWAARTAVLICPRQNGKNAILEARELAGLFLFGEQIIVHSAHEQATASNQFKRVLALIEGTPKLRRRMARPIRGKGSEAIELKSGQVIYFKTRTGGGTRGWSIDCIVFDEAYNLPEDAISAMVPTRSARPNTQTWYTSSAVDALKHPHGTALTRQRQRGLDKKPNVAFFEWSAEGDDPAKVTEEQACDPVILAPANPGFNIRLLPESIEEEFGEMGLREFAVERLGIGDWPDLDPDSAKTINPAKWKLCFTVNDLPSRSAYAVDVTPDRAFATVSAAGNHSEGPQGFEVVKHGRGTGWIVDFLVARAPDILVLDGGGPAASLIPELEKAGLEVTPISGKEYAQACGFLYDAIEDTAVLHGGGAELDTAVDVADTSPLGDAFKWSRKDSTGDITPLVAGTLAIWGLQTADTTDTVWAFRG